MYLLNYVTRWSLILVRYSPKLLTVMHRTFVMFCKFRGCLAWSVLFDVQFWLLQFCVFCTTLLQDIHWLLCMMHNFFHKCNKCKLNWVYHQEDLTCICTGEELTNLWHLLTAHLFSVLHFYTQFNSTVIILMLPQ